MTIQKDEESPFRKSVRAKLNAYFVMLPEYPYEQRSGTPIIPKKELTPEKAAAVGPDKSDPIFLFYTKRHHRDLLILWAGTSLAKNTTTCNDFCCHVGYHLGAKFNVGLFPIEDVLKSKGLGSCWVPSTANARPKVGDIFVNKTRSHMGVAMDFYGGGWWTVEAGQGGPTQGYDSIKRKVGFYNPNSLSGWVDMEKLLSKDRVVPDWLVGWWIIYEDVQPYFYYFAKDFKVSYGTIKPGGGTDPLLWAMETVPFTMPQDDEVSIAWEGGTLETLRRAPDTIPGIMEKLVGITTPPYGLPNALRGVRF